ncbi:hypothetical protein MMIC_P0965 [Mariprofundus micogutta]|uniref:Magnesium transporter MgtE intracellular domain-containing protein n=1 Tax=Mariprofundus micogutta TaxID=1921010 RepID=A0A1L8CM74_9PROT|nr:hypothetical protein [Mariprofundus micogutta]GAV20004.1 hypothetical protein MMIC_P0965 [Mariprofundus micogutta]
MSYRKISILLFAMVGLSLSAKVGINFLAPTKPHTEASINASIPVNISDASVQVKTAGLEDVTELSVDQSLLLLENYIFPEAEAAGNDTPSNEISRISEDGTLVKLREYKSELDSRKSLLDQREQKLHEAEEQVKQRITELEQLEASIQQRLLDESKVKSKKIKRLTAVYEGMKPERAAPVIAKMELATVVKIFLLMDEKKVGKILSFLPPEKAVLISQALTRQISSVK